MSLAAIWAIIVPLLPAFGKVLALLTAWLAPSPLQKATKAPQEVSDAEKKADNGDPSDLDHL